MSALTVSNYLGNLQDNPHDAAAYEGLKEAVASKDPARLGEAPLRLIELARGRHEQRGEHQAAAWLIDVEIGMSDDDPDFQLALLKELGRLRAEELMDTAGAIEAFSLAQSLREEDDTAEQIEQLEAAEKSWREIADRFIAEAEDASDPSLKASMLVRAAALSWQFRKKGRAKEVDTLFAQALEAEPGNTRAARLFGITLRDRKKFDALGPMLMNTAENARNRDEKVSLYIHAARVFERETSDRDNAAICYERVLDFTPGQPDALTFLVEYFTEKEQWDHLVALYEDSLRSRQKLESEQGILIQLAMVHWRIRNSPEEAEPYFARLRKTDPTNPGMLTFYREYLKSDDPRLLTILSDAQRVAGEGQKLMLALELARSAQQGEHTERAIDAWKAVQRLEPSNLEAVEALRDLYRKGEKWNALVEVMRAEVDALDSSDLEQASRKLATLREMVHIYRDHLKLDVMVINTYNAILAEAPEDAEALEALAATYESMGRWNDLIRVLTQRADASQDTSERVALYSRVASLWIERFANYNQATKPLESVLELDPDNRGALAQLKDIYSKKRAWASLYDVLKKEGSLASDPAVRLAGRIELAQIAGERLHKHADAIALWKEVLAEAPDTPGALDALEKLAEREKDWDSLADVLERRIDEAADDAERIKLLQKLGPIHSDHRGDPAGAARAWQRVLVIEPKNGRALRTLREAFIGARDWAGLESLYAEANDWEGLVEVLGNAADRTDDVELKKELSFRAAHLYENQIGEPHRAFRNYERVLSVDSENVQAATALAPIYEKEEKWPRLVGLLELLARNSDTSADGGAERLSLLERLRILCLTQLGDTAAAFRHAAEAYRLAPADADTRTAVAETAERAGAYAPLLELYRERVAAPDIDAGEKTELRRRIASVAGEKLGATGEAIVELKQILAEDPRDVEALDVLGRLYRVEGKSAELRELYDHRLAHTEAPSERWVLLTEVAELEEHLLEQPDAAAARYRAILEIDPMDADSLRALDRLASAAGRWEEVSAMLERRRELAEAGSSEAGQLALRHADVLRTFLARPAEAVEAYAVALKADPGNEACVRGLEALLEADDGTLALRLGRVLEPAYTRKGEFKKVNDILERRLAAATDEEEIRTLRLRLAELAATELGDADGAYRALEAAFLDRPSDVELWDRLAGAAEQAGKHEELAVAYSTAIEAGGLGNMDVLDLSRRTADLYEIVLNRPDSAEPFHKRVLSDDPVNERSFVALKELYTNRERWDDLQALYRNRIAETIDAEQKRELLLQVCFLFEELLEDFPKAIQYYQEVLELTPDHAPTRKALDRLYRKTDRYRDLAALRREDLDRASGAERIDITFELGEIAETRLDQPVQAVDYYEQVLLDAPTHMRAQEALERLMTEPSQRQRVASILEPLYSEQGAYPQLVRALEVQLEDVRDAGARVALLTRIGEVNEERLQDVDRAFGAYARAVEADPSERGIREVLARLATIRDAQRERAAVLERAIESVNEPYLSGELLLEVARLWDEEEGDPANAERAYQRLIAVDPENPDNVIPASQALERIHLGAENYGALADDLRRQIRFEHDVEQRGGLLVRLAELLETTLNDRRGAIDAHREQLENAPDDVNALRALERLYETESQWQNLVGVLQNRDALTDDPDEQRVIARRVGEVYALRLGDLDNAIVAYNDVLGRFGADAAAYDALVKLYTETEKWDDLLEVREQQLELVSEPADMAELRFAAAELMRLRTQQVDRAIEAYGEVLATVPGHAGAINALEEIVTDPDGHARVEAARVLVPHYQANALYAELINGLEVVAESDDPVERLEALRQAAEVAEIGVSDTTQAFGLMGRAVRAGVAEDDLGAMVSDYGRLAEKSEQWAPYVATLRDVAPDIMDGDLQVNVMMTIAAAARDRLADIDMARLYYRRVLEQRPDYGAALDALQVLQAEAGDYVALLETLRRKTEVAETPTERVALLLEQARISEEALEDVRSAIDALEAVVLEDERHAEAYAKLESLYARADRHADLAAILERQLEVGAGDRVALHYRLGKVQVESLDDPYTGMENLEKALKLDGNHEPSIAMLRTLMGTEEHSGAAARILEPVYLARMEWPNVRAALEARLASEHELEARKSLLGRMGQLHEDYLEDLDGALEAYARLFNEDPRDRSVWDTLTRMTNVLDGWERLGDIYAGALDDVSVDDEDTAELCVTTARIFDERRADPTRAAGYFARALRFDPTRADLFAALESVYQRTSQWEPLLQLYRERIDLADSDAERVDVLHRAAEVTETKLEDAAGATELYREIIEVAPDDARAVAAVDRLLGAANQYQELADHLRFRIDAALGTPEEASLRHRLGVLQATKLEDLQGAIDTFEEVLRTDPTHAATVSELEQLVMNEEHQRRITEVLEPIYRQQDQWRKLIAILEAQASLAETPEDAERILGEVATLHETRGGDSAMALEAWGRAFAAAPHSTEARAQIDRLAEQVSDWGQAVAAYERAIEASEDPTNVGELLAALARIQDEKLGDPRAAITTYERLVEHDPDSSDALNMLEGLHTMVGDWTGMVEVLNKKTERSFDPMERAEFLRRAGSVLEELLANPAGAIESYTRATVEDPNDAAAYESLDLLYTKANKFAELSEVLARRVEVEEDPELKIELGLRLAQLEETQLSRPQQAIDALLGVLSLQDAHPDATLSLARLYERQAMWPELLDTLRVQAEQAHAPELKVGFVYRAGSVLERELDDVFEALEMYRAALEIDPAHEPSLTALTRISHLADYREQAAEVLEPLLRAQGRHDGLAELLRLRADGTSDPFEKKAFLRQLAETHEVGRSDAAAALESLRQALTEDSSDEDIQNDIERLVAQLGKWGAAADTFAARAAASLDPQVARGLFVRTARIAETQLGDDTRAVGAIQRAVEQVGDEPELLATLDRLHEKTENWSALGEVLERRISSADDPQERVALLLRLGALRNERFQDLRGAFAAYQEVVEAEPGNQAALAVLETLTDNPGLAMDVVEVLDVAYRAEGRNDKVLELYDIRIRLADTDGERVRMLQDAAVIWENDLGDTQRALASMRRAFEIDPRDTLLSAEVERLAEASGAWESLRGMVETVSKSGDLDGMMVRDLNVRAAGWYRDRLGDAAAAEACLRVAIRADAEALDAHAQLVELLRAGQRNADLIPALRAWAEADMDEFAKKDRLREASSLAAAAGDTDTASACLVHILDIDPTDPDALDGLIDIRTVQEQWPEVVQLLAKRVEVEADPGTRMALRRKLAELYAGPLQDTQKATLAYEELLEEDPTALSTIDSLEELYTADERWNSLRELIERRLDLAETTEDRISARVRMARLDEQAFGRRGDALEQLQNILEIDPNHVEALDEMERLLGLEERWEDVAEILERRSSTESDPGRLVALLTRLADVRAERLEDAAGAIAAHDRILAQQPAHEPSLRARVALFDRSGDKAATADALDRLLPVLEGAEALATTLRVAELAEQDLGDLARAEAMLRQADALDASGDARKRLRKHLETHGKHVALAQFLAESADRETDDKKRVALFKEIAALYTDKLGDAGSGATYLERAAELNPEDRDVLLPLCDLYIQAGRQADAVPVLQQIIASFGGRRSKELAAFHHRLGKALDGMGDQAGAMEQYDAAFRIDLTNVSILKDLGILTHRNGDFDRAQKTFRALLLQKLQPEDGLTKADVYFYLGDISHQQGEASKAISMLERAVAEDSSHERAATLLATLKS
ncbi:MAG: tetratricopeptide repeat protein [Sandaracinaceae bacterium]|nr:tetratricopeptide repeat protein [Sandaracinaceae bacterium]